MDLSRFDLARLVEQPPQVEMGMYVARVECDRTAVGLGGAVSGWRIEQAESGMGPPWDSTVLISKSS